MNQSENFFAFVERFIVAPSDDGEGDPVRLTPHQMQTIRDMLDGTVPMSEKLAAWQSGMRRRGLLSSVASETLLAGSS